MKKYGTLEQATIYAERWLNEIKNLGINDVSFQYKEDDSTARYHFVFTHSVTKEQISLIVHGYSEESLELECGNDFREAQWLTVVDWGHLRNVKPQISDWVCKGFKPVVTFEPII